MWWTRRESNPRPNAIRFNICAYAPHPYFYLDFTPNKPFPSTLYTAAIFRCRITQGDVPSDLCVKGEFGIKPSGSTCFRPSHEPISLKL
jgi:hypothetical protein